VILNLQALRAYAALLVLFHHGLPHWLAMGGHAGWFGEIARWGFAGVDVFFVLSGYVIAHSTSERNGRKLSAGNFCYRRFGRIYLGYWPFLVFSLLVVGQMYPQLLAGKKILLSTLLLTPYTQFSVVAPAWSLSYELWFYAIFSLCLVFTRFRRGVLLILFCAVVVKLSLVRRDDYPVLDFFLSSFVLEFLAGVLLFELRNIITKTWVLGLSVVLFIVFVYLGMGLEEAWGITRVLTWGGAAVFLVLALLILEEKRIWTADRWSVKLGDASYTLYLSHTILLTVFYASGIREWLAGTGWIGTGFVGTLAFIVVFSLAFYRWVEHPLYRWYLRLPGKSTRALSSAASVRKLS